jgi:SAM-dependent methyltransferase
MDPKTLEFYQTRGSEWAARLEEIDDRSQLDDFLDRLAPGTTILELGCGDGRDAEHMLARGFEVSVSDGSPAMAALASRRLGRVVPVMDFAELDAVEAFDAAWCRAALLHIPERELPAILARIHRALRRGGWHWASFKGGTGDARDQFGRFYSYLPRERLEAAYRSAGDWSELALATAEGFSFGGTPTLWHTVVARK